MSATKNLTIGVLTITAVILLVGVILTTSSPRNQAWAFGQIDRGGDYIMMTGQFTENQELVYITDAAAKRMNVYSYVPTRRDLILWETVDLTRLSGVKRKNK
ncbi:MAG: hypothetical protein MI923_05370 [Phycisphaerales bacterium]|nr:hypothetical protein [Phycisphaerales bacterium]